MRNDAREAAFKIIFADLFGNDGEKNFAPPFIGRQNSAKRSVLLRNTFFRPIALTKKNSPDSWRAP